jgi:hypothetical protein
MAVGRDESNRRARRPERSWRHFEVAVSARRRRRPPSSTDGTFLFDNSTRPASYRGFTRRIADGRAFTASSRAMLRAEGLVTGTST